MSTAGLPDIAQFTSEELQELRNAIDARLEQIRTDFIEKAATLGLTVVDGNAKKRKRRSTPHKEQEQ